MLLIAEIILTVFAWRNGWKWFALLPMGIAMLIGFCIGFIVGYSGNDYDLSGVFILDIIAIIVLIIMISVEKKVSPQEIKKEN